MYSSLMDHNSINTSVIKGEKRMATAMHKCTQRSPCENDSRRSIEKLKYKIFEVVLPVSTDQELGPGRYSHQRPTDIGLEKRKFQVLCCCVCAHVRACVRSARLGGAQTE